MKKFITDMDIMGAVQFDLSNIYTDGNFEISIPFRFVDGKIQECVYSWFDMIAKNNEWKMANYSDSDASFRISYCTDTMGKPAFTYEVFVYATSYDPADEKSTDDPTLIFTPNLSDDDKKVLKRLMIQTITEQMMNVED